MKASIGRRLRLALRQPETPRSSPGADDVAGVRDSAVLPDVEFVAYTADCWLSGRLGLDASRLSDMLNAHDEYQLTDVLAERLPDGGSMVVPELVVTRAELLLVHATGPRGDRSRRTRTRARGMALRVGPYLISGDVHASPDVDPLVFFRRRRPMVPLTDATIEYATAAGPVREFVGTIVVNRDQLDWVTEIDDEARAVDLPGMTANGIRRRSG